MTDTAILISALETAPGVIIPLIREVPPQILKRRPSPTKWSAHERAVHLSQSDVAFRARLDLILSTPNPDIESIENSPEDEAGAMLEIDLVVEPTDHPLSIDQRNGISLERAWELVHHYR